MKVVQKQIPGSVGKRIEEFKDGDVIRHANKVLTQTPILKSSRTEMGVHQHFGVWLDDGLLFSVATITAYRFVPVMGSFVEE
jgi:hypothetical protein